MTAKSGAQDGAPFAPSWRILEPAIGARRRAETFEKWAAGLMPVALMRPATAQDEETRSGLLRQAAETRAAAWEAYEPRYVKQMRASYQANSEAWLAVLKRRAVTLMCYCPPDGRTRPKQCHRALLAELFKKVAARVGRLVFDAGEVYLPPARDRVQITMFSTL